MATGKTWVLGILARKDFGGKLESKWGGKYPGKRKSRFLSIVQLSCRPRKRLYSTQFLCLGNRVIILLSLLRVSGVL